MVTIVASVVGGIIVAIVGGYFTYLGIRRKTSGQVSTSDAATLWSQAQEMREELKEQVKDCNNKCDHLEEENLNLRKRLVETEEKVLNQRMEIINLKDHVVQLQHDLRITLQEVSRQSEVASVVHSDVDSLKHEMSVLQGGKSDSQ